MIKVGGATISLDRRESEANMDFISHAHTDHIYAAKKSDCVIASNETMELIKAAYGIEAKAARPEHKTGIDIKLFSSGHMMGAKQLVVTSQNGERIAYTGDFQMQKSRAAEKIEIPQADKLIIDSTYPYPKIKFEERGETEVSIQKWTKERAELGCVLFGAYAMGKAQELIAILNEVGITPAVTKKIAGICSVYNANGYKLDYIPMVRSFTEEYGDAGTFVGITEKPVIDEAEKLSSSARIKVFTGVATGFAKIFRFDTDVQFPLSDHADFVQSVDYITATGAKTVLTYGKGAEPFARSLRLAGFDAKPFDKSTSAEEFPTMRVICKNKDAGTVKPTR
jgi:hypothetical protein